VKAETARDRKTGGAALHAANFKEKERDLQ
jgi:hypothetical protein